MRRLAPLIFRNFWNVLALTCGAGLWATAVVLGGWRSAPLQHVAMLVALAAISRAAALWCEREVHHAPVTSRLGRGVLAVGFGSFLVAGTVGVAAVAWGVFGLVVPTAAAGFGPGTLGHWARFGPVADAAAVAGALLAAWGYVVGPRWLRAAERTVPVVGLPAAFEGYTIVHLSDLHLGPLADRQMLRRALDRATAAGADLICITGDIVDSPHCDLDSWVPELQRLGARDGVVAILGNHDEESDADRVTDAIRRHTSIRVLRDEAALVRRGSDTLALLGLEHHRPPRVTEGLPTLLTTVPAGATPILLAHHPDAFDDAVSAGIPLTLAGHTHGGQLAVPFFRHLNVSHVLVSRYDVGWFRTETHRMHVSAGLGASGQQVRIGTRPEITIIRLERATMAAA